MLSQRFESSGSKKWNGDRGWSGQSYAKRNGCVCDPGKRFKGSDGGQHICQ
jgi:hypothetical protein